MTEKKNIIIIILISLLVISVICVGIFVYQLLQMSDELAKQTGEKGSLIKQLIEVKELIGEERKFFRVCKKIEAPYQGIGFGIKTPFRPPGPPPANLIVIDPEGKVVGGVGTVGPLLEAKGLYYSEWPDLQENKFYMLVRAPEKKIGDYLLIIIPTSDVLPTDTYTLELQGVKGTNENTLVLSRNVPFGELSKEHIYIFKVSGNKTEIIPIVPASVGCQF